jgi:peroxiredoxin
MEGKGAVPTTEGVEPGGAVVLFEGRPPSPAVGRAVGEDLWIAAGELEAVSGWVLKAEGACRGDICVPIPREREDEFLRDGGRAFNLAAFARLRGQPVAFDATGSAWSFGAPAPRGPVQVAAPDFELPDLGGELHSLADYRGRKVVLYAWATWCSCRWHLPDWQALHEELEAEGLVVISVAIDGGGAEVAAPFIEAANPTHPSLIDEWQTVTELFGLANVPNTVWIDEQGRIVRGAEAAGMIDVTGAMDRDTRTLPEEVQVAEARARHAYEDVVRDWVRAGRWTQSEDEVRERVMGGTAEKSRAIAHHRLGKHLLAAGEDEAAVVEFASALRLDPQPWALRRDAWALRNRMIEGESMMSPSSPLWEEFWAALDDSASAFYPATELGEDRAG